MPTPRFLKSKEEAEEFIREEINKPIPHNTPQWRMYWQEEYDPAGKFSLIIWKQHHSLCDGASVMCFHLTHGVKYDTSCLIPFKGVGFLQRLFLRTTFPFYIPKIVVNGLMLEKEQNPLHDGKRELTGRKVVGSSNDINFKIVKATARRLKITLNDMITACLSAATKQYFEEKGDKETETLQVVIPANIRFNIYETAEQVKLENKFAPANLKIPL